MPSSRPLPNQEAFLKMMTPQTKDNSSSSFILSPPFSSSSPSSPTHSSAADSSSSSSSVTEGIGSMSPTSPAEFYFIIDDKIRQQHLQGKLTTPLTLNRTRSLSCSISDHDLHDDDDISLQTNYDDDLLEEDEDEELLGLALLDETS